MQYTVRAFIEGQEKGLEEIRRTFSSVEIAAYT